MTAHEAYNRAAEWGMEVNRKIREAEASGNQTWLQQLEKSKAFFNLRASQAISELSKQNEQR